MNDYKKWLTERFRIERQRFDRSGVYAYTQRAMAYNSNKIEGSTLTPEQTASLFDNGTLPQNDNYYRAKDVEEIVGLDMNAAKEAFSEFLDDTNLDSRQIYFVNQIVEYIVHNGMMKDLSVLQESPFTDKRSVAEIFTDMTVWMGIRKVIDQINTNAAA